MAEIGDFLYGIANRITGQLNILTKALGAQGVSQIKKPFDGEQKKFKEWIKSVEKYAVLSGAENRQIKLIAYQASVGTVSDFIQRYLSDHPEAAWEELREELTRRFAEITDPQHAFMLLRMLKQKQYESVQMFTERLLNMASEAYTGLRHDGGNGAAIERQLVGFFIDGLSHDYLKMKVMRENPANLATAVIAATNEQNIRARFSLRVAAGVRVYFDLGSLRVGKTYVPLEDDVHISSIIRLAGETVIKPQSKSIVKGKVKNGTPFEVNNVYEATGTDSGYLGNEPGLLVSNSIVKLNKDRYVPMMIVNTTNRTYRLKRGCILGKLSDVPSTNLVTIPRGLKKEEPSEIEIEDVNAPDDLRQPIQAIISDNKDLFAKSDLDLGHTETVTMRIDTGNHAPIKQRPYRVPLNKRQVVDKAVDDMLEAKIIRHSRSPWSFPIVVVDKKDGSKRFCVDFRALNKVTRPISTPLPLIDDILTQLGHSTCFTTLDLKSGYWQIGMDPQDQEKTAFACHRGLFEFSVMPFGLCNAPSIFMELMNKVLEGMGAFAIAYLDDILIFSQTQEEHLNHIKAVFKRLREHSLKLKLSKCTFTQRETKYLGFTINSNGIKPDGQKVRVIQAMGAPTTVKEVRSFIGMRSYYRRFIPNFSKIAEPIIKLTKKFARFQWSKDCQRAFDFLKESLTVVPLLTYPDPNQPYTLYTDASDTCIGACLTQKCQEWIEEVEKPIHFLSHKLTDTQCRWSTIEKEAYAIHYALQKLDHYIHNAQFKIRTDHQPLRYLLESPMQNRKVQQWALGISGYNCTIEYIKGVDNTCADLLSRIPAQPDELPADDSEVEIDRVDNSLQINVFDSGKFTDQDYAGCLVEPEEAPPLPKMDADLDMVVEQSKDDGIQSIKKQLETGTDSKAQLKKFLMISGILYYITDCDDEPSTVAHLLIEEIFPRHGCPLEIVTDNGTENVNHTVKETLETLRIHHIRTSFYHPQSNARVERFHRTLHDVLAKKLEDSLTTWDLYLNQTVAAIRFHISESSKFSPFFLLYNRDVVLPVDNLLKPRRKYTGEEEHKIALQQQHKSFILVHRNMRKAKRRQAKYANRYSSPNTIKIGDPVYYRLHQRKSKLQNKWQPYYRVMDQTSPVTYIIRNQLDGTTTRAHAEHLRVARLDQWEIPKDKQDKPRRRAYHVVPPSSSSSDNETEDNTQGPFSRIVKRYRQETSESEEEENIPLAELAKRMRQKPMDTDVVSDSEPSDPEEQVESEQSQMDIDAVSQTVKPTQPKESVKALLRAVAQLL
ncbi:uncharacterized protein [Haliotis asinina]|uniref:uncharacterized protein n=1 Tax=Haliotis asinina TaxID=109174 RepID=UPI0035327A04